MLAASKAPQARGTYNDQDDESALLPSPVLRIAGQTGSKKAPCCINSLLDTNLHLTPDSRAAPISGTDSMNPLYCIIGEAEEIEHAAAEYDLRLSDSLQRYLPGRQGGFQNDPVHHRIRRSSKLSK
jgi:hypothetical protein